MDSHQALHNFVSHHSIKTDSVGNCRINAIVDYDSDHRNTVTNTSIKIIRNGYDDGTIKIDESDSLQAEDYHLDLSAKWQSFTFKDSNGKLIIKGNSPKLGSYTIEISPS